MSLFTDIQEQMITEEITAPIAFDIKEVLLLENDLTSLAYAFDKACTMHELLDVCTTEGLTDTFNKVLEANGVGYGYLTTEAGLFEKIKSSISTFIAKFLALLSKWKNSTFGRGRMLKLEAFEKLYQKTKLKDGFKATDAVAKAFKAMGIEIKSIFYDKETNIFFFRQSAIARFEKVIDAIRNSSVEEEYKASSKYIKELESTITDENKVEVQKKIREELKELREEMSGKHFLMKSVEVLLANTVVAEGRAEQLDEKEIKEKEIRDNK